jgi:hypothetical protein
MEMEMEMGVGRCSVMYGDAVHVSSPGSPKVGRLALALALPLEIGREGCYAMLCYATDDFFPKHIQTFSLGSKNIIQTQELLPN